MISTARLLQSNPSRHKFGKPALAKFGHNFLLGWKFHKTWFHYFCKYAQDTFSRWKLFSGRRKETQQWEV